MDKYRFAKINDYQLWDNTVVKSNHYSVFSNSSYLRSLGIDFHLYFIYKGQQVKGALSLLLEKKINQAYMMIYVFTIVSFF